MENTPHDPIDVDLIGTSPRPCLRPNLVDIGDESWETTEALLEATAALGGLAAQWQWLRDMAEARHADSEIPPRPVGDPADLVGTLEDSLATILHTIDAVSTDLAEAVNDEPLPLRVAQDLARYQAGSVPLLD